MISFHNRMLTMWKMIVNLIEITRGYDEIIRRTFIHTCHTSVNTMNRNLTTNISIIVDYSVKPTKIKITIHEISRARIDPIIIQIN